MKIIIYISLLIIGTTVIGCGVKDNHTWLSSKDGKNSFYFEITNIKGKPVISGEIKNNTEQQLSIKSFLHVTNEALENDDHSLLIQAMEEYEQEGWRQIKPTLTLEPNEKKELVFDEETGPSWSEKNIFAHLRENKKYRGTIKASFEGTQFVLKDPYFN